MRKSNWISLSIALVVAGLLAGLEQRRAYYFIYPRYAAVAPTGADAEREEHSLDKKLAALMQRAENFFYDARFRFRGNQKPHPDVVIIAVDEQSLRTLHEWPWPRSIHSRLIRTLQAAPPKALLFDIFFVEPFTSDPLGDRLFAKATRDNPWVVHSAFFNPDGGLTLPYPALLESGSRLGYVNATIDEDGVLRRTDLQRPALGQNFDSLSLEGASLYLSATPDAIVSKVPLDPKGRILVHFIGHEYTYPYVSYADVLSGKIPARLLAGKVLLVGSSATGTFDHYPTPMSRQYMPGVELHANVIDNLIHMNTLKDVGLRFTYGAIALFGLFCGFIIARCSAGTGALWMLGLALLFAGLAQGLFVQKNLVMDMAGPLLTLVLGYGAIVVYRFFTEEREKRLVRSFFSEQVSSDLLNVLMENPGILKKAGERREMTALFSDVAGFTSISERLQPEELVELLNKYLTAMTEIIFEYGGYVDKYMGDGVMAFWNGLLKQPNHAERACRCAIKSMQRLKELNVELEKLGLVPLKARIGINTGTMAAGYMGSSQKKQYTIMGDNVNLASRLEGANKAFGTEIMISEFTRDQVEEHFDVRFLDILRVPGKARPVKTYELLGEKGAVSPVWAQVLPLYHQAIQDFGSQHFEEARRKFLEVLLILGHDKPCETYIQRAEAFIAHPPPKDWDGVFELKTK